MDACTNPDILRVIWFFKLIVNIVKIIIPIALIILGIVDFSKAVITNDENVQKKSGKLFVKRLIYAILIFTLPWLIEVLIITLGNLSVDTGEVNFTDCLENANGAMIEKLESIDCGSGKVFTINYYNEDGSEIKSSELECTEQAFYIKTLTKYGYTFKGWDFKNKPTGGVFFDANKKYTITEDTLKSVVSSFESFDLIPVFEKVTLDNCIGSTFKVNYYDANGGLIIKTSEFCTNQEITFEIFEKEGYTFKGWDFKNKPTGGVFFEADKKYTITEDTLESVVSSFGGFDLIPVLE